jgi:hypothetical protein
MAFSAKPMKNPCINPDSRESGRESGLPQIASTAISSSEAFSLPRQTKNRLKPSANLGFLDSPLCAERATDVLCGRLASFSRGNFSQALAIRFLPSYRHHEKGNPWLASPSAEASGVVMRKESVVNAMKISIKLPIADNSGRIEYKAIRLPSDMRGRFVRFRREADPLLSRLDFKQHK